VSRSATVTTGQKIRGTLRIRASEAMIIEIRGGSETTAIINVTTEWQTLTSTTATGASSTTTLGITARKSGGDLWFEFDYVFIEQLISETYRVPKRDGVALDASGRELGIIGDGRFINCETCLLFPDVEVFQTIDDHLEFFYERYGDRRKLSWERLYSNPYGMDRVFVDKSGDVLERMVVINPSSLNRDSFIKFLTDINRPSYVYNKITKGAIVFFNTSSIFGTVPTAITQLANARNVTMQGNIGKDATNYSSGTIKLVKSFLKDGNTPTSVKVADNGSSSFDFIDEAEELEFASEIASGDLIAIDTYDSKRGAYIKYDFPDFVTNGILINTTKVSGTLILDNVVDPSVRYASFFWIPAGQSGVPSEIEETPLTFDSVTNKLYFRKWDAALHFGVTFTNTDAINIYVLLGPKNRELISLTGTTAYLKHARNLFDSVDIDMRIMGWQEGHPGELLSAKIVSKAAWDAGMLFATSGAAILDELSLVFANQNNPREWCGCFGHSRGTASDLDGVLNTWLPMVANENRIYESDTIRLYITDASHYEQVAAKCDELGILFFGALDLIKNMQFNDYSAEDFFKK
jgi:hypothetical protein